MEQTEYPQIRKLKLFKIFLIKHGVFYQFYYYMLIKHKSVERALIAMKMAYPQDYIMKAFYWGGTKEGAEFWNHIQKEWIRLLYNGYEYF